MFASKELAARFDATKVLVVDDEHFMRKVVRTLLLSIGIRTIYEASNGPTGLDIIRSAAPHVVIVDWQMPGLDGTEFVRMVRSPDTFPYPDVPIIMLTGHGERSRVVEAVQIGVNEFLIKPVSSKSLHDRLVAVLVNPRPMVRIGDYYGPAPRKMGSIHTDGDEAVAKLAEPKPIDPKPVVPQPIAPSGKNSDPAPPKVDDGDAAFANVVMLD